jgi:hypothetical protein
MRKLLLVALVLVNTVAFAQVQKGDKSITYAVSYIQNDNFQFGLINAKIGRYLSDHLEVGLKPEIQIGGGGDITIFNAGAGLYFTYNFLTESGKTLPYFGADLSGKGGQTINDANPDEDIYTSQVDVGLYGGFKYFFTERVNLDISLNYGLNMYNSVQLGLMGDTEEDPDYPNTFSLNFGIGILLHKKSN